MFFVHVSLFWPHFVFCGQSDTKIGHSCVRSRIFRRDSSLQAVCDAILRSRVMRGVCMYALMKDRSIGLEIGDSPWYQLVARESTGRCDDVQSSIV